MASAPKRVRMDNLFKQTVRQAVVTNSKQQSTQRKVLGSISNKQQPLKTTVDNFLKKKHTPVIDTNRGDDSHEITCDDSIKQHKPSSQQRRVDFADPYSYYVPPENIEKYPNVEDFDKTQLIPKSEKDYYTYSEPHYAMDIFINERQRELLFVTRKYLKPDKLPKITPKMRAVLVNWMVQVQDGFALTHEVLYTAVKIVDQYLMRKLVSKTNLQLLGLVALVIACKLDERLPPEIDEFLDATNRSYRKEDVISFEIDVLKTINFELSYPLSYRFLRRFARTTGCDMKTLTLARYILESSLVEYEFVDQLESKIAAAALLLAMKMQAGDASAPVWTKAAEFYSTYTEKQLKPLMYELNENLQIPEDARLSTVRIKYMSPVLMCVAKISPLHTKEK